MVFIRFSTLEQKCIYEIQMVRNTLPRFFQELTPQLIEFGDFLYLLLVHGCSLSLQGSSRVLELADAQQQAALCRL